MKRLLAVAFAIFVCAFRAAAQVAVIEESVTEIDCDSRTHAVQKYREVRTILSERGSVYADFACQCSKNDRLTAFKGTVTDGEGRTIRRIKQGELQRTEYSPYLAIDSYTMFFDFTPSAYPLTVTYEWTIESRDNLIEFAVFCPQTGYEVEVKRASYRLKAPSDMRVRHALQNITGTVTETDGGKNSTVYTLETGEMKPLFDEPFSRPLRERLPIGYFAPTHFTYFGTQGSLENWADYGLWQYNLAAGSETLPDDLRQELHSLTDNLTSERAKVEAVYKKLERSTRYVAVLLGIGGQRPAPASNVAKSGFGDCKGLSNFMKAMLAEVGIASNYTTISTANRRLLPRFASVGQMNHVILQVPLARDTLWLECTNPQLPMGYVHSGIAGHDAIEVSSSGGRLVTLPVYADTANLMRSYVGINLSADGAASITVNQQTRNHQYENSMPLLAMSDAERRKALLQTVRIPQAEDVKCGVKDDGASLVLYAGARSKQYATVTGQRIFVPVCPLHNGYKPQRQTRERQDSVWIGEGFLDEDHILIDIPEGFEVETLPADVSVERPFGTFRSHIEVAEGRILVQNRLLLKSGTYPKALYPALNDFIKTAATAYNQKAVLRAKTP